MTMVNTAISSTSSLNRSTDTNCLHIEWVRYSSRFACRKQSSIDTRRHELRRAYRCDILRSLCAPIYEIL